MTAYVSIQIIGKRAERLLERMRQASVAIYALHRVSDSALEMVISVKDYKRLHVLARSSQCRIRIVDRLGAAFVLQRYFHRYTLWGGILCMYLLFVLASFRILWIDIDGCSAISETTILRALKEEGVCVGVLRKGLDFPLLNARIRAYDDRIAWVGLSLDGVVLRAKITESLPTSDKDPTIPADMVASKSGRITRIEAMAGRPIAAVGDLVDADDILITGDLTTDESQYPVYVHASGRVHAEVVYVAEVVAEPRVSAMTDSGNSSVYREIKLLDRTIFATPVAYEQFELRDPHTSRITDTLFPITMTEARCFEQVERSLLRTKEEQTEAALYEAEKLAYLKIPKDAKIIEKSAAAVDTEHGIVGIVTIITEESIGLIKEITIGTDRQDPESQP